MGFISPSRSRSPLSSSPIHPGGNISFFSSGGPAPLALAMAFFLSFLTSPRTKTYSIAMVGLGWEWYCNGLLSIKGERAKGDIRK